MPLAVMNECHHIADLPIDVFRPRIPLVPINSLRDKTIVDIADIQELAAALSLSRRHCNSSLASFHLLHY